MGIVVLHGYKCERCGHEWVPRDKEQPKVCPRCKSPYWNVPRKQKPTQAKPIRKKQGMGI